MYRLHAICWILAGFLLGGESHAQLRLEASAFSNAGGTATAGSLTLHSSVGQSSPVGQERQGGLVLTSGYPPLYLTFDAPAISHTPPAPQPAGEAVTITAQVGGAVGPDGAVLHYREGGTSDFTTRRMTESGEGSYEAALPDGVVTNAGVAYFITVDNPIGGTYRAPTSGVYSVRVRVGELVKEEPQPGGTEQSAYRIVSVPVELEEAAPEAVLADDLGSYDPSQWRFFELEEGGDHVEFPATSDMVPGEGFWLIVREGGQRIDTGPGLTSLLSEPYTISLHPGWNLVGTPFAFPVPADQVHLNGEAASLRAYEGGSFNNPAEDPVTEMEPFQGYAVFNEQQETSTLLVDPASSNETVASTSSSQLASRGPTLQWGVRITASSEGARDADNMAGVAADASREYDAWDYPEPPAIGSYVSVAFPHPEWGRLSERYATDVRPEPVSGTQWTFEVDAADRPRRVQLRFDGVERVPDEYQVWLFDEEQNVARDLRATPLYEVMLQDGRAPRALRLVVGTSSFVEAELGTAATLPASHSLSEAYPNPASTHTRIRYGMPEAARVTAQVYNVLGQQVRTLLEGEQRSAGYHVVEWDGRDSAGQRVASGLYLVRFEMGDFVDSKRVMWVR